jgi:hypothetical protein
MTPRHFLREDYPAEIKTSLRNAASQTNFEFGELSLERSPLQPSILPVGGIRLFR